MFFSPPSQVKTSYFSSQHDNAQGLYRKQEKSALIHRGLFVLKNEQECKIRGPNPNVPELNKLVIRIFKFDSKSVSIFIFLDHANQIYLYLRNNSLHGRTFLALICMIQVQSNTKMHWLFAMA
jgi:hypothetical protein